MFASCSKPNLQEIGTGKVWHVLRASFAVATCAEKDPRVREIFHSYFRAEQSFVALIDSGQFLLIVFYSARRGALATLDFTTPSVLESQMFFHSLGMVEKAIQVKLLKGSRLYSTKMLSGFFVQKFSKVWTVFKDAAHLSWIANMVSL